MGWLSDFLGIKKVKTPAVRPAEEIGDIDEGGFSADAYMRELERKSGFEDTIITGGRKKPKLAAMNYLGAR